jgi:hypothetical protein
MHLPLARRRPLRCAGHEQPVSAALYGADGAPRLSSADWAGWDIEGDKGLRIEVKQSAARQTWTELPGLSGRPCAGAFDIAARTGYFADGGSRWVAEVARHAHVYILAWHPIEDLAAADQRDPQQWLFFVIPSAELPADQKTISRAVVQRRWTPVGFEKLREATLAAAGPVGSESS